MKSIFFVFWCVLASVGASAQQTSVEEQLELLNEGSVPYVQVDELYEKYEDFIVLDTRSKEEYDVSHLPNAIWAGETLDTNLLPDGMKKDQKIVVYCTIGVRSENFGEQLSALGYEEVYNLYGSIFFWVEQGCPLENQKGHTKEVHTYDSEWAKLLEYRYKVH